MKTMAKIEPHRDLGTPSAPKRARRERSCVLRVALAKGPGGSASCPLEIVDSDDEEVEAVVAVAAADAAPLARSVRESELVATPFGRGVVLEAVDEAGFVVVQLGWGVAWIIAADVARVANKAVYRAAGGSVALRQSDLQRLNEGYYLNDSLIDFELKRRAPALERSRAVAFTSFFLEQLARGGHASVSSWTRRIDVFAQRFLLFPVHEGEHWSLAIVCHPGAKLVSVRELKGAMKPAEASSSSSGDVDVCAAAQRPVACIVCLDSLGLHRTQRTCMLLRKWLTAEWAARKGGRERRKFAPGTVPAIAPRNVTSLQSNLTDCGLYLLHFADEFVRVFGEGGVAVRHLANHAEFEALGEGFVARRSRAAMLAEIQALVDAQPVHI